MNNIIRLWNFLTSRRRTQILYVLFASLLCSFLEVFSIGALVPFLAVLTIPEDLFNNPYFNDIFIQMGFADSSEIIYPVTAIFCFVVIIAGIFRVFLVWLQNRVGHSLGHDISYGIFRTTLWQGYSFHAETNSSDLVSTIVAKANQTVYMIVMPILNLISGLCILITVYSILLYLYPVIVLSALLSLIIIFLITFILFKKKISISGSITNQLQNKVFKVLQESYGSIRDIIISSSQDNFERAYRETDLPMRRAAQRIQVLSIAPRYLIEALIITLLALYAFYFMTQGGDIEILIPAFGVAVLTAQRTLPEMQKIYQSVSAIKGGEALLESVLELLTMENELVQNSSKAIMPFKDKIVLKDLSFQYPNGEEIFNSVNLSIEKGKCYGIIGETGSGKSTLMDIVMGLCIPNSGEIIIDGEEIEKNNIASWQRNISHVPQSIFLSDTTVAENIAFEKQYDVNEVRNSAKLARIDEFIEKLDNNYQTLIGERGEKLSGGQRQRLGIARALYRDTPLLILDEATSALDDKTEQEVIEEITKLSANKTILMIAHRLSTLKNCDHFIKLKNGNVVISDNLDDL